MNFSIIAQDPKIRKLVQEGFLERNFHEALVPRTLFREEVEAEQWQGKEGDEKVFSRSGLIEPDATPIVPGDDASVGEVEYEQWSAMLNRYGKSIDTDMPTDLVAIASLFMENTKKLGIHAAMTLNRRVRAELYNAAESGWTVADGGQTAVTSLRVKSLNGFTRARNPNTVNASRVRFDPVTTSNPLSIQIFDTAGPAYVTRSVVGFTPDIAGDERGPGTLTLSGGAVTVLDRAAVKSIDRTDIIRVGGGDKVDDVTTIDKPTFSDVRAALALLQGSNVQPHSDGLYHCHLDPTSVSLMYDNDEMQRLNTGIPDYSIFKKFALGELLGTMFVRNNECPIATNTRFSGGQSQAYSAQDPFAPELYNNGSASTGMKLHRALFTGRDLIREYYADQSGLISEAGLTGKMKDMGSVSSDGIELFTKRVKVIFRAPLDRLQSKVASTWSFIGTWSVPTDATTGSAARFKRCVAVMHGE